MPRRPGLGRGLDALIPAGESLPAGGVAYIPVARIVPNPRQPRGGIEPDSIEELAASIRQHGIIQPLIVTYDENAGSYTLIAGERRLHAARLAGLDTVPAVVREATDQQRLEIALIENIQRSDLNPLEAAEAYRQLSEDFHLSHEDIANRVGKSRAAITNTLRLLKLARPVQQAVLEKRISEGHARCLLALPSSQAQTAALQVILAKEYSVRQTEEYIRRLNGERALVTSRPPAPVEITALEDRLRSKLGTRVRLRPARKGGTLVIHYYSDEELNSLIESILGESIE